MSWGYWGIVTGLMVLLAIFFVCVDILYRILRSSAPGNAESSEGNQKHDSGRHAA
jgi:hypothetical protein